MDVEYYQPFYEEYVSAIKKGKYSCHPLGTITNFVSNGRTAPKDDYTDDSSGIPIIKVATASKKLVNFEKLGYVKQGYEGNEKVQKGDIFILSAAHQAEYVGKNVSFLAQDPSKDTYFVGELIGVRANPKICDEYYLFGFLSNKFTFVLINREKRGQTSHIYPADLREIFIPTPPLKTQKKIAREIQSRMKTTNNLKKESEVEFEATKARVEKMILGKEA